jgi:hypothetical protein
VQAFVNSGPASNVARAALARDDQAVTLLSTKAAMTLPAARAI